MDEKTERDSCNNDDLLTSNVIYSRLREELPEKRRIFTDWFHTDLNILKSPPNYPPEIGPFSSLTTTTQGIIAMCIPSLSNRNNNGIKSRVNNAPETYYCWTTTKSESTSNPQQEIAKSIVTQYQHIMPKMAANARVNTSVQDFRNTLSKLNKTSEKTLFHYFSHESQDISPQYIVLHSNDRTSFDYFPIGEVLSATHPCSVHIIECDHAGLLIPVYNNFIISKHSSGKPSDIFAFFSCSEMERMPHSPGLPSDIFTSCMTTPAKMALLWHSRHYHYFNDGPLRPLSTDFYSGCPESILDEVSIILHRLVEAMAFDVFDRELYLKVFRSDQSLAHFASNFFLASRILSFFGIHPKSTPEMPNLINHHLWSTFDLRLDVALQSITSNFNNHSSLSFQTFLEQNIDTLISLVKVNVNDIAFPAQLTFIPPALISSQLNTKACKALALYIDKSISRAKQMWLFPVIVPLFQMLQRSVGDEYLTFVIAKIFCITQKNLFSDFFEEPYKDIIFPLFSNEKQQLFGCIIGTMYAYENETAVTQLLSTNWQDPIWSLLDSQNQDTIVWCLLLLSIFIQKAQESHKERFLQKIIELSDNNYPSVRLTALYTLQKYFDNNIPKDVFSTILQRSRDLNSNVRIQVILLIAKIMKLNSDYKNINEINDSYAELCTDPNPMIQNFVKNIGTISPESKILEWCANSVLYSISEIISSDNKSIFTVQSPYAKFKERKRSHSTLCITTKFCHHTRVQTKTRPSTHLENGFEDQIYFGTNDGDVLSVKWNDGSFTSTHITDCQISHITSVFNSGFPLVLCSNIRSNLYIMDSNMNTLSYFKLEPMHDKINYDECKNLLYSYGYKHSHIFVYDMIYEKHVSKVPVIDCTLVKTFDNYENILVYCGKKLRFFDTKGNLPIFSVSDKIVNVYNLAKNVSTFAMCNEYGNIYYYDARNPTSSMDSYQLGPENLKTLSFSAHPICDCFALSNSRGVYTLDLITASQNSITELQGTFKSRDLKQVNSCLFNSNRYNLAMLQDSSDLIILHEEKSLIY